MDTADAAALEDASDLRSARSESPRHEREAAEAAGQSSGVFGSPMPAIASRACLRYIIATT